MKVALASLLALTGTADVAWAKLSQHEVVRPVLLAVAASDRNVAGVNRHWLVNTNAGACGYDGVPIGRGNNNGNGNIGNNNGNDNLGSNRGNYNVGSWQGNGSPGPDRGCANGSGNGNGNGNGNGW